MDNIINIICNKTDLINYLKPIVKSEFFNYTEDSYKIFAKSLAQKIKPFIDDAHFVIEYPYVDKIYRDSYYNYFASKYNTTKRDCIRISLFKGSIVKKEFRNNDYSEDDNFFNKYKGFFIIRPTDPNFFGRSVINPSIYKNKDFSICTATFKSTILCNKFKIKGFPHSSQDSETISCAETTLWALMEYFSSKYQDYTPVLPSKIINVLDAMSTERQLPSRGLDVTKLSFALKKFNFGSIIYASASYGDERFRNLLSCYTNSGIPLILAIQNNKIAHALLSVGTENIKEHHINTLTPTNLITGRLKTEMLKKQINFYDLDDCRKRFVFIDDNYSPYQLSFLNNPSAYYQSPDWSNTKITHFIVPLYSKIYLEAFHAKNYIYNHMIELSPLLPKLDYYLKIFLASSRTYKDFLAKNNTFSEDIKELILEMTMPKFIWICEISDKNLIKQNLANGLIIIDATEPNITESKPLIYSGYNENQLLFNESLNQFQKVSLVLQPFMMFNGNLQTF